MTTAEMELVEKDVLEMIDKGVPYSSWSHQEQMYHAFYMTGQKCPSSPSAAMVHYNLSEDAEEAYDLERQLKR